MIDFMFFCFGVAHRDRGISRIGFAAHQNTDGRANNIAAAQDNAIFPLGFDIVPFQHFDILVG